MLVAVGLVAGLTGPVAHAFGPGLAMRPAASRRYVVRPGDTLWSIASRGTPGADPRPLVDAIEAANHLDPGSLVPGQTLLVPLP